MEVSRDVQLTSWALVQKGVHAVLCVMGCVAVKVNMLTSSKGTVLRCDVNGKIVMKVFLSGMPDVKLGLNDKLEVRNVLTICRVVQCAIAGIPLQMGTCHT